MRQHLLWISVAALLSVVLAGCSPLGRSPRLLLGESVESDFQALAEETWTEFLTVFKARSGCFGDVHLHATRTLDSRAAYDPETATVTVRVPGTSALLQGALVHEWAHHVEFQCDEHEQLQPAFLAAQGLPADTPWRPENESVDASADWRNDTPSEQYAEATIVLVLGRRHIATSSQVKPESVRVIEAWAKLVNR